jgi:hypothetical protein
MSIKHFDSTAKSVLFAILTGFAISISITIIFKSALFMIIIITATIVIITIKSIANFFKCQSSRSFFIIVAKYYLMSHHSFYLQP